MLIRGFLSLLVACTFSLFLGMTHGSDGPALIPVAHAANCNIDDNLTDIAQKFVGRCCKGSVKSVFPASMWNRTVGDIKKNRSKNSDFKTAWKLLGRTEYRK